MFTKTKSSTPAISIIVPVFNASEYLEKCFISLVNQSLRGIELIFINDGSTDNSMSLLKSFADTDDRVIVLEQNNQKQGAARNNGLNIANGEYIGFVDSDDYVDPNFFEKLLSAAKEHNADIAIAPLSKVRGSRLSIKWDFKSEKIYVSDCDKFITCDQKKNTGPCNKVFRSEFLRKHGISFPEGTYYEDGPFTAKAVHLANKLVTVPGVMYYYVQHSASTIHGKQTQKHLFDAAKAKKDVIEYMRKNNVDIPPHSFHYTKSVTKFVIFPLYCVKENIKYEILYLFGLIPIAWRKVF
ncbi:MAG: glycosyltransferase [Holosporales bacterium]|jgi:glycosyltransferase involved in cell wall biosynthesis|nr:glycosyltransferase [Holosporales bacterium]